MATENGAKATGFGDEIGSIAVGKRADLVVLDYRAMRAPFTAEDISPVETLIYRAKTSHVTATIVEGRVVYRDGRFTFVDREATFDRLRENLDRPDSELEAARGAFSRRILPHINDFYRDWEFENSEPWYRLNGR